MRKQKKHECTRSLFAHSARHEAKCSDHARASTRETLKLSTSKQHRARAGVTLLELVVVVVILGAIVAMATPSMMGATEGQRLRSLGVKIAAALDYARSEAIRTGNIHLVFVGEDTLGASLLDNNGNPAPVLVLNDGRPGSGGQNCTIDGGEIRSTVPGEPHIDLGAIGTSGNAPADLGAGDITTGSSFRGPDGNDALWVAFRPEGTPRSFDSSCAFGALGTGAGAFYLNNGDRNVAVVLSPMGNIRVHSWNGAWSQ